jgi:hypothetical protein
MHYIVIDTCVWLELIRVDTHDKYNLFDEVMYWISNGNLKVITCPNLIAEWQRNRENKRNVAVRAVRELHDKGVFSTMSDLDEIYKKENVEAVIDQRIDSVDHLLQLGAELAEESDDLYLKASKRTLLRIAPNHIKDSFLDTVNYMAVASYVKKKGYNKCYFTTINKVDFSEPREAMTIHQQLKSEFEEAGLEYHYFNNDKNHIGGALFNRVLKREMPSFKAHLNEKERENVKKREMDMEAERRLRLGETEPDFLHYSNRIDEIVSKSEPDEIDKVILEYLFKRHPSYENYFFRKIRENGLV